jgi:LacI family transcriptional regulator
VSDRPTRPNRGQGNAPTILDVARHAGVSRMTVSRVINGEGNVKAATRRLVDASIRALNYAPNPAARTLAAGGILRIGLLSRIPSAAYLGEFLIGALDRCSLINAQLIVRKHPRGASEDEAFRLLMTARLDGVILPPPLADTPRLIQRLRAAGMAVVATGAARVAPTLATIGIDDRGAAREMTRHLVKLGHRRIAFITGLPNHASSGLRLDGYRDALAEAGLEATEHLLALDAPPTAIFASNDDMAAAAVAAAHRHRLDVPGDLSVCGFDDTPVATTIWPELTTIRQPVAAMADGAVTMLARIIAAQRSGETIEAAHSLLDFELIRRDSDAAPRGGLAA